MIDLLVTKYTRLGVKALNVHCYANCHVRSGDEGLLCYCWRDLKIINARIEQR